MKTFAQKFKETMKKGLWRKARKQHFCDKSRWDRKTHLDCCGILIGEKYFDTQELDHDPFNTFKICKICAEQEEN